jgi:uncharacterized delta-60 repeat protein
MRHLRALLLVSALLASVAGAGGAGRAAAAHRGLDRTFGNHGTTAVTVGKDEERFEALKVTRGGRSYILYANQILAFQSNGKVAGNFGEGGRLTLAPDFALGEVGAHALALDSQGRLVVTGSAHRPGKKVEEAWVIRLLPNGSRDLEFGTDGEFDTTFGLPALSGKAPSVSALTVAVDAADRPVVGGSFAKEAEYCGDSLRIGIGPDPFVARLTSTGALDGAFGGTGHAVLKGPGEVSGVAATAGDGVAVFSHRCAEPPRYESTNPQISAFSEGGEATPTAQEALLPFTYQPLLLDPQDRVVELEGVPPAAEGIDAVTRRLPNGEPDPSFGRGGRAPLGDKPHYATTIAVDAQSRPIIALFAKQIVLRRYLEDSEADTAFGPGGRLTAKGTPPSAIALDAEGRIYTVSVVSASARTTITLARFIPGS